MKLRLILVEICKKIWNYWVNNHCLLLLFWTLCLYLWRLVDSKIMNKRDKPKWQYSKKEIKLVITYIRWQYCYIFKISIVLLFYDKCWYWIKNNRISEMINRNRDLNVLGFCTWMNNWINIQIILLIAKDYFYNLINNT